MNWLLEHWLVLTLLAAYTALMVHHAATGRRLTRGVRDYYIGGRSMGGLALGLSFFATYSSTNSFLGFSGQSYAYGTPWLLLAPCAVFFTIAAWLLVAPRLRRFTAELDSITIPDFVGFRFGSESARVAAAGIVLLASFPYMTAVFKGIGNLLEIFLEVPYPVAIGLVFVIVMLYTAVGGFISVVRTDVVQGVLMILAAVLLCRGVVGAAGGLGALDRLQAAPETAGLFAWDAAMPFPILLGILVATTMKLLVEPRQLSRFYALENDRAARTGFWVASLSFLAVYVMLVPLGLFSRALLPAGIADTDLVIPTLLSGGEIFGPAVSAFLVVAMIAAAMSSLDSVLLVTATTCQRDLIERWRPPRNEQASLRNTRILVAVCALVTSAIALDPPGRIVALTSFSGSLLGAALLPAVLLGLHWRRGSPAAVLASFVVGLSTLLLWEWSPLAASVHEIFPAVLMSTAVFSLVARLTPEVSSAAVLRLFD